MKFNKAKRKRRICLKEEKSVNQVNLEKQAIQEIMNIDHEVFEDDGMTDDSSRDDWNKSNGRLIIADKNSRRLHEVPMIEVSIINKDGKEEKTVKAMIDTGAQISLIDSELVNEVKWDVEKTSMRISGFEGPDRLVMAAGACYGIIELEESIDSTDALYNASNECQPIIWK